MGDLASISPAQSTITRDASTVSRSTEPVGRASEYISNHVNVGNVPIANGQNQHSSIEGEGRGRKKPLFQGRGKGIGAVPKSRGPQGPGWTGAGFDVDGKN